MSRKKKTDTETDPPSATPPGESNPSPETAETNGAPSTGENDNGAPRKPVISWRLMSDRTTSVELACWVNTYRTQSGEEYEQLSFTVQRSYRDQEGTWAKGGSWRTHDLPVLTFLIAKAHAYALDRRTTLNTEVPF